MRRRFSETTILAVAAGGLLLAVWAVYAPTFGHDFVDYDDNVYVFENESVKGGLSRENLLGEWGRVHRGNYHPLTMLSHALDVEWFGLDAGRHHATNVALHAVNSLLLLLLCRRLSGGLAVPLFVAAAFAVHPLNVQSVAWIAERKNVLSTLFWFAGLWLHLAWRSGGSGRRYAGMLVCFACGLLAKPMLVTFPFTVWILDELIRAGAVPGIPASSLPRARRLWAERAPLFGGALIVGLVTLAAQSAVGAVQTAADFSAVMRLGTAASAYGWYLLKLALPTGLAANYLHPLDNLELWRSVAGAGVMLSTGYAVWYQRRRYPELAAGWCWYFITLLPVSGLLTVGFQPWADRYAYVPLVGVVWALAVALRRALPAARGALAAVAAALLLVWAYGSHSLMPHWRDSISLFGRAVEVVPGNYIAEGNLAKSLLDAGRVGESVDHFRAAAVAKPELASVHINLGNALSIAGEARGAARSYAEAVRLEPDDPIAHFLLGRALAAAGEPGRATGAFRRAIVQSPEFVDAHLGLASALTALGDSPGTLKALEEVLPHVTDPALERGIRQRITQLRSQPR